MANLNIPFLLLDKEYQHFNPSIDTMALVPFAKYTAEKDYDGT